MGAEVAESVSVVVAVVRDRRSDSVETRELGEWYEVWRRGVSVGRDPSCVVTLDDPAVPPVHVWLSRRGHHHYLELVEGEAWRRGERVTTPGETWRVSGVGDPDPISVGPFHVEIGSVGRRRVWPAEGEPMDDALRALRVQAEAEPTRANLQRYEEALGARGWTYKGETLVRWWSSATYSHRARAVLAETGPAALPGVLRALEGDLAELQIALDVLEKMGAAGAPALPSLLARARRERGGHVYGSFGAISRLARAKRGAALQDVYAFLKETAAEPGLQEAACYGISSLTSLAGPLLPVLISLLEGPDDEVWRSAAAALRELGRNARPVLPALEALQADREWSSVQRQFLGDALARVRPRF